MYISRDIETQMVDWLKFDHLALQIDGGRQVGKTTTILQFAQKHFKNTVYVNLRSFTGERFMRLVTKLQDMPSSSYYLELVQQFAKTEQIEFTNDAKTVFVIDEIQESKKIYEMVREFTRNLHCKVIITGSYLARALDYFQPIGDVETLTMYPFNFLEFIQVWGGRTFIEKQDLMNWDSSHDEWYETAYQNYLFYGGYPDVVKSVVLKNYQEAKERKKFLNNLLKDEIQSRLSSSADRVMVSDMLSVVVEFLASEKRGSGLLTSLTVSLNERYKNMTFTRKEVKNCVAWLKECGILDYCDRYDFVTKSVACGERFYFRDLGILSDVLKESPVLDDATKRGILAENFVFKTLNERRIRPMFGIYDNGELDFYVVAGEGDVSRVRYGIEVKSGRGKGKTITKLLSEKKIDKAIFFKGKTLGGVEGDMITLPLWCSSVFSYPSKTGKEELKELEEFQ